MSRVNLYGLPFLGRRVQVVGAGWAGRTEDMLPYGEAVFYER